MTGRVAARVVYAPSMAFTGFADTTGKFFSALGKNQSRDWFLAHKDAYTSGWEQPMRDLLVDVSAKIDATFDDCELLEPKVFRLHRDVRFSKDKTPYKTFCSGVVSLKSGSAKATETPAAVYLQIGSASFAGAGLYGFDKRQLERYRSALLDETAGRELDGIVRSLSKKGFSLESADSLKKVPRGFDPEHPRAELAKRKGLVAAFPKVPASLWVERALVAELAKHAKATAPLVRWLAYSVMG